MVDLTQRFELALNYSFQLHKDQVRKATGVPYFSHVMSTAALVIEHGGDEDQAIAALLHDAVEDQGGMPVLDEIESLFGKRVAFIVDGCTDAYGKPKPPWRERKEAYLKKLESTGSDIRLVSLADKLHNARCLLTALRVGGDKIWNQFNGGKKGTIWYYDSLLDIFQDGGRDAMTYELARVIDGIHLISGGER